MRPLLEVFGNRDLRRVLIAWGAVSFSTWAYAIALGVYAYEIGGATAVGVVGLVRLLPGAIASPFAGLLGDRHSRRAVIVASALGAAIVLAGSAAAAATDAPAAVVYLLAGLFTVISSAYVPAEGALLPVLARTPQELAAANVCRSTTDNVGFLLGSIVTGVLLATASPQAAFAAAALVAAFAAALLVGVGRDKRPDYVSSETVVTGVVRDTAIGFRALIAEPRLRLVGAMLTALVFFEGAADVLVVILALDLLDLGSGSVGYLNAGWGVGALLGGAVLALLLNRGNLAAALMLGSLATGAAMALPGIWPATLVAFAAWVGIGVGYTFVDVVARTLMQRLGSDEVLARVLASLETSCLAAMAAGSIAAPALVALVGTRGALIAMGAMLPLLAALRWASLREFEIGAPVAQRPYALLRANPIFEPLPVATLERLSHDLVPQAVDAGEEIITQGDRGDRFYVIDRGEVEVYENGEFRRNETDGESFGEIALLHDVPRTATVRATRHTRLLRLDREHFISAVTGHHRSREAATAVADERLSP